MTYFTHGGLFHCDEVAGNAICRLAGVSYSFERLTDLTELPDDYAIIADIGREYDPERNRFDHHQAFLTRPNNYPYASAGLLWKHFGEKAIDRTVGDSPYTDFIHRRVDERLIQGIDAHDADSQYEVTARCYIGEVNVLTLPNVISAYNADDIHNQDHQRAGFQFATKIIEVVLRAEIISAQKFYEACEKFASVSEVIELPHGVGRVQYSPNAEIIILREPMPWKEIVHDRHPRAVYVICPSAHPGNKFSLHAVPVEPNSRTVIMPIERPEWFTGFIHQGRWIAGGETIDVLLELAKANLV